MYIFKIKTFFVLSLTAILVAIYTEQVFAEDPYFSDNKKTATSTTISSPQTGVKLLQEILDRLHNFPQLAMRKTRQIITSQNQISNALTPGPTNPLLAIKPQERAKSAKGQTLADSITTLSTDQAGQSGVSAAKEVEAKYKEEPMSSSLHRCLESKSKVKASNAGDVNKTSIGFYQAPRTYRITSKQQDEQRRDDLVPGQTLNQSSFTAHDKDDWQPQRTQDNMHLAWLAPTIITGIPLLSLGISEQQVDKTLSSKGVTSRQLIGDWTVISLSKAHLHSTAVQVYIRHNMVEAIRVFDPSLINPELGIKFGDNLSTVKQKFGEPLFIVPEPQYNLIRSQNYVYPISQISFQLARTDIHSIPEVISLLIFNIK